METIWNEYQNKKIGRLIYMKKIGPNATSQN